MGRRTKMPLSDCPGNVQIGHAVRIHFIACEASLRNCNRDERDAAEQTM